MPPFITEANKDSLDKIVNFLQAADYLTTVMVKQHIPSQRQRSLAEHNWKLGLAIMAMTPHFDIKIDLKQALKMAVLQGFYQAIHHDQHEAHASKAFEEACLALNGVFGLHFYELCEEYQQQVSYESRVVKSLSQLLVTFSGNGGDDFVANKAILSDELSVDQGVLALWNKFEQLSSCVVPREEIRFL